MKNLLHSFLVLGLCLSLCLNVLGQNRANYPLVIEGNQLTSLTGLKVDSIVAFRYENSSWIQIPVQIDERVSINAKNIYFQNGNCTFDPAACASIDHVVLTYADTGTFTGADSDPLFDDDDELVFMAEEAGSQAPQNSYPGSINNNATRCEVTITDPILQSNSYVYLFANTGQLAQGAGQNYGTYTFNLLAGDYKTNYNVNLGFSNPESSTLTTNYYSQGFTDRWVRDETKILLGDSSDILDRHKVLLSGFPCSHTDEGFSVGEGAMIANIDGPVRGIRAYIGSLSGPLTERNHFFMLKMKKL